MQKKKINNIADSLIRNSETSLFYAVETYNKITLPYRRQQAVILLLNSWNLALKAVNHKINKKTAKHNYSDIGENIEEQFSKISENKKYKTEILSIKILKQFVNFPFSSYSDFNTQLVFSVLSVNISLLSTFIDENFKTEICKNPAIKLNPADIIHKFSVINFFSDTKQISKLSDSSLQILQSITDVAVCLYNNGFQKSIIADFSKNTEKPLRVNNSEIIQTVTNSKSKLKIKNTDEINITLFGINEQEFNNKIFEKIYTEKQEDVIGFINNEFPRKLQSKSFNKFFEKIKTDKEITWIKKIDNQQKILFTKEIYSIITTELRQNKKTKKPEFIQKSIFDYIN